MRKNQKTWPMAVVLAASLSMTACSDSSSLSTSQVTLTTSMENTIEGLQIIRGTFTFENVSTGNLTKVPFPASSVSLTDGLYHLSFIGKGQYLHNGKPVEVDVQGVQQNVTVTGGNCQIALKLHLTQMGEPDFVIAEVFVPGTRHPNGKPYNGDQYVRITNNSDRVLYADGLLFLESQFMTTQKYQSVTPDILPQAMAVNTVVAVPGSGSDHPVQPGESIILCDNAINHLEANPNSIDLSRASFEWYIESKQDVDNPRVPNLNILYCYTKSIWILNKQGNRAYAIGRLPKGMTAAQYLADYRYDYTYVTQNGLTSKPQHKYRFPNEWVIDAVNLGAKNEWQWNVTAASLDLGHTFIGPNSTVAENVGKCVQRKVAYQMGTRAVLQDTNNSTVDFQSAAKPSLLK